MKTSYRPEIDGLRAIAILPVVLFDFDFAAFRGGFVGVDAHNIVEITRNDVSTFEADTAPDIFKGALSQTAEVIKTAGLTPMIMRQPPEGRTAVGLVLKRNETVDRVLRNFDGRVVNTWQRICAEDACRAMQGQEVYYFDNNHLTNSGAIAICDSYAPVFTPVEQRAD